MRKISTIALAVTITATLFSCSKQHEAPIPTANQAVTVKGSQNLKREALSEHELSVVDANKYILNYTTSVGYPNVDTTSRVLVIRKAELIAYANSLPTSSEYVALIMAKKDGRLNTVITGMDQQGTIMTNSNGNVIGIFCICPAGQDPWGCSLCPTLTFAGLIPTN